MTTQIPLTQGAIALVDDDDAETVLAHRWRVLRSRNTSYAQAEVRRTDGSTTTVFLHTLVTGYAYTDHINGEGLDCRRINLRPATNAENQCNRGRPSNNTSGFKGVTWNRSAKKWQAQIGLRGTTRYLGVFDEPQDAARAYDAAAREHYGEFARLNFRVEVAS